MKASEFIYLLRQDSFSFITGVPDSIFQHFLVDLEQQNDFQHIISNNEGEACALAAGYYLGTANVPIVYMQNSGLGNCINPLTSLLDSYVYSIPALLLISWRGMPGKEDEPQHARMGEILPALLSLLGIPFCIASDSVKEMRQHLTVANSHFQHQHSPFAILFPAGTIVADGVAKKFTDLPGSLTREAILELVVDSENENTIIVSTTGKTSRELFEIREKKGQGHQQDFLTVGSMGCASAIAAGLAIAKPARQVTLLDGDGACLMRMETMTLIGHYQLSNLVHLIIDNNAYDSTGGQQTVSDTVDFTQIALGCGYRSAEIVTDAASFVLAMKKPLPGPRLIVIKVTRFSRDNLGRPSVTPLQNKRALMDFCDEKNHSA